MNTCLSRTLATVAGLASVLMISGCAADVRPSGLPMTTSSPTSVPAATGGAYDECVEITIPDHWSAEAKVLQRAIAELPMPTGTCLSMVHTYEADQSGMLVVYVHLNVPKSAGANDLRAVATDIARLVKGTAVGERISTLGVTNRGVLTPSKYPEYLVDESFQEHAWNGTPSREADMASWSIAYWPA